jgi:NADPH-dependent glutamate synthase beta subunit-like oxidoreductase
VSIVYRRARAQMPAYASEVHEAELEGVTFVFLATPTEFLGDNEGRVQSVRCERMALGQPDATGRLQPTPTGDQLELEADLVITALGTRPEAWISTECAERDIPAGGDAVRGPATVVEAIGDGVRAAAAIDHRSTDSME